jgi:PAS domain S-box-containing protein
MFDNKENRQILGVYKLSYFLNRAQFLQLMATADAAEINENLNRCIEEQKDGESIVKIEDKEQVKYVSINYKAVVDEDGDVIKVRGTSMDITRLKQSEFALKESEYKLKQAEHIAKVGYWNYDYETDETHFSDEVWNILELKKNNNAINFADFFHNIHPDDKAGVNILYLKSRSINQPFDIDFRIVTKDNDIKHIKAKGTFVINKLRKPVRSIGTFQDITVLKEKEIELVHTTSHLIEVQKLSKTGYIELQYDTNQTVFSETIWDIIEETKGCISSQEDFNEFINPIDKLIVEKTLQKTLAENSTHNIQYRLQLKNGKIKYINEICIVGHHSSPERKYATRIVQDISQMKERDVELEHSLLSLKEVTREGDIGTWEYSVADDQYFISDELQSMLNIGDVKQDFTFEHMIELIHPDDRYSVKKMLVGCLSRKDNYSLIYRIGDDKRNDIKYIHDSGRFVKKENGEWQIVGLIKDISNEYQSKLELMESNDLLRTIVENSLFATSLFSDGKYLYVNDKWSQLVGFAREKALRGAKIVDVFKTESVELISEILQSWDEYKLEEYSNNLYLQPKNAKPFYAEVYIKEVTFRKMRSFIVLAYDVK